MDFRMKKTYSDKFGQFDDGKIKKLLPVKRATLPEDYLSFLKQCNGGVPENAVFEFLENGKPSGSVISCFLGVFEERDTHSIGYALDIYAGRIPKELLPIADDAFGNLILMGLKKRRRGKIYFWDHELESDESTGKYWGNVTQIAEDFSTFFQSLSPEFDDEPSEVDPFEEARKSGDITSLKKMLEEGFSPNQKTTKGSTIARRSAYEGQREIFEMFCDYGANLKDVLESAIRGGHDDIAFFAIEAIGYEAFSDSQAMLGILFAAAECDREKVFAKLVDLGVDINTKHKLGYTVRVHAMRHQSEKVLALIECLKAGGPGPPQ
ncbi:MAG: SMI1/KNR4 family protein [Desulfatibacillum sp.]|nr:SMI1/KNR4 family protein [Desulfatibacillum sp.]